MWNLIKRDSLFDFLVSNKDDRGVVLVAGKIIA
jgi:hypothetical protein